MNARVFYCLFLLSFLPLAHAGDDLYGSFASGKLSGYGKVMYVFDDKKGGRPDQSTPGFGGKIAARTGDDFYGFSVNAAWYTTQDLGLRSDNPRETDAYMFDLDKTPYSLLGEASLRFAAGASELIVGRQEFFSPIVDTYDYRIIPNLFEGITLHNRDLPHSTLTLAYISKMSGLDGLVTYSKFRSMSQQAYTSLMVADDGSVDARNGETLDLSTIVGDQGVWLAGWVYDHDFKMQLWNFYGQEMMNTVYLDGTIKTALSEQVRATLQAQAYRVSEVGAFKDYLAQRGLNASYGLTGIKTTLAHPASGLSVAVAFNRFTGNARTVTAAGNWGGYPEFVSMPYMFAEEDGVSAIAGSRLAKISAVLDLAPYGLAGHSLLLGHARIDIDDAILPDSDLRVNTLTYRMKVSQQFSARLAVESRQSNNTRYDNNFVALSLRYDF